ncbi:hypothetical protein [Kibdelosporangium philippinense]|uniref:hypothetical protein n=1 Tax=Kibdelosporangium philippinense TaxID=211113 RepID=UPI00361019F5
MVIRVRRTSSRAVVFWPGLTVGLVNAVWLVSAIWAVWISCPVCGSRTGSR